MRSTCAAHPVPHAASRASRYRATIARTSEVLCENVQEPRTHLARLRGLLGAASLGRDTGLWLRPSSGVHTFGMRFSLDLIVLDRRCRVLAVHAGVLPGKVKGIGFRTRSILELAAGAAAAAGVRVGDTVNFKPKPDQASDHFRT